MALERSIFESIRILYIRNFNRTTYQLLADVLRALNNPGIVEISESYTLSNKDQQKVLQSISDDAQVISVPTGLQVGSTFLIERLGTGAFSLEFDAGIQVNGQDGPITATIDNQYTSAYLRVYASNQYKIEGNVTLS